MTNAHVVQNATRIEVELPFAATGGDRGRSILGRRGRTLGAQVVAVDEETDLAVIKVAAQRCRCCRTATPTRCVRVSSSSRSAVRSG